MRYGINVFNYAINFLFFLEKLLYYYENNYKIVIPKKDFIFLNTMIILFSFQHHATHFTIFHKLTITYLRRFVSDTPDQSESNYTLIGPQKFPHTNHNFSTTRSYARILRLIFSEIFHSAVTPYPIKLQNASYWLSRIMHEPITDNSPPHFFAGSAPGSSLYK